MHRRALAGILPFLAATLAALPFSPGAVCAQGCAVYVSTLGTDAPGSGLAPATPCRTISYGITAAVSASRLCLFVQAGTYNEVVVAASGVSIVGGFDSAWKYHAGGAGAVVIITGGLDAGIGGQYLVVRAHDLAAPVHIMDVTLQAPNAADAGKSSYVAHMNNASVTFERDQLVAGNGASGVAGAAGMDAVSMGAAPGGASGANAQSYSTTCDATSFGAGGAGVTSSCVSSPSARVMNGGRGGDGGTMDTNCGAFSLDFNARPGFAGSNAGTVSGSSGLGGLGGAGSTICGPAGPGSAGLLGNGVAGVASTGMAISSGFAAGNAGGAGATGENGGGGGGGGGSGGCDNGTDSYGAGGGGGGAGGCAARGGGAGGASAGCSIGVMAVGSSTVTLSDCTIQRGVGGLGGAGGTGGQGQPGGAGGAGGLAANNGAPGGSGGKGAHGGHGGGGAGGQGGYSIGVLGVPGVTVNLLSVVFSGGTPGSGGAGGASAPNAAVTDRDGYDGPSGSAGGVFTYAQLPAPAGGVPSAGSALSNPPTASGCDPASCGVLAVPGETAHGAGELAFHGAAPNPALGATRLAFSLANSGPASIGIYDLRGARVRSLAGGAYPAGESSVTWDLRDESGSLLPVGMYWARLEAGGRMFTRTVIITH